MLTYGRFFAEFLEDHSLVRLGLLALNTCVGLRYGLQQIKLRSFSWKRAPVNLDRPRPPHFHSTLVYRADLPTQSIPTSFNAHIRQCAELSLLRHHIAVKQVLEY